MEHGKYVSEEQMMLPCRFYVNGFCANGARCRFYHPSPAQLPRAIHVPPLPADFGSQEGMMRGGNRPAERSGSGYGYAPPPSFDFVSAPRPTQCYFGREPDAMMRAENEGRRGGRRGYNGHGQEGDARRTYLPRGVTSTYQNGMVSYEYPPNQETARPGEGRTMFTHINWNEFLLPGMSAPPYVDVPLELDEDESPADGGTADRTQRPEQVETASDNADAPPEGLQKKKMTPREEFQLKVKSIALEVDAPVPGPPVRSLDSFFSNYNNLDLERLPPEMLERKREVSATVTRPPASDEKATEMTSCPTIPELEEGELVDSDSFEGGSNAVSEDSTDNELAYFNVSEDGDEPSTESTIADDESPTNATDDAEDPSTNESEDTDENGNNKAKGTVDEDL